MSKNSKPKSYAAFNQVCSLLNFSKDNGLISNIQDTDDAYLRHILSDTVNKLEIDAIYFLKSIKGGPRIPIIYFKLMEYPSPSEISEIHKLSWNMGQAPLLFIVLPDTVQVFNNLEPPKEGNGKAGLIEELKIFSQLEKERKELIKYERAEFETGNYWRRNINIFKTDYSVFKMLLKNLDFMRLKLINGGLSAKIVYSILIRSIFIKYLEDRKDQKGYGVFPDNFFNDFLSGSTCFIDLLNEKEATYNFFKYLSDRFNGDIFVVEEEEENTVRKDHLDLLKRMLSGEEYLDTRQMVLWPLYAFDVIPIELISSIYEQFLILKSEDQKVSFKGIHYTRYHLVSFLMDEVLPLSDTRVDIKIFDPSCGSGIFLVEGYRRLVARWIKSNHYDNPNPQELIKILRDNIFGVDIDSNAIRITALSLYLTLCDYLEPKTIWNEVKFEKLINNNLFDSDFFNTYAKFTTNKYDLIVGNPPWESKLTDFAENYLKMIDKKVGDRQICQAFLWKCADICKPDGKICLIVSSKALLFNRSDRNSQFRKDFFSNYYIKAIFNFSALRHSLFSRAVGPGAAIIFSPTSPPEETSIFYCSPKPSFTLQDELTFLIEPQDIANIPLSDALESEVIWKVAMWGLPRDYDLIKKMSLQPTLYDISKKNGWIHGEGYIIGNEENFTNELHGKLEVTAIDLKRYIMDVESLKQCSRDHFERFRNMQIYKGPHLLIKQSPKVGLGLISAVMIEDSVFPQSIIGIHSNERYLSDLIAVCYTLNSNLPLYYAMLTSGRWLVERDELTKEEIMNIPIPRELLNSNIDMEFLEKLAEDTVFQKTQNDKLIQLYGLDDSEKTILEDTLEFTLDFFRLKGNSMAIEPPIKSHIKDYMKILCDTINHQFMSSNKSFCGIIYVVTGPLRIVALKLNSKNTESVKEELNVDEIQGLLKKLDQELIEEKEGSVYIRRHLRRYSKDSIYIIKPNQRRYWSRSSAISDADKVYSDIMSSWRTIIDDI